MMCAPVRERTWEWYKSDLYTRLKPGAKIVFPLKLGDSPKHVEHEPSGRRGRVYRLVETSFQGQESAENRQQRRILIRFNRGAPKETLSGVVSRLTAAARRLRCHSRI